MGNNHYFSNKGSKLMGFRYIISTYIERENRIGIWTYRLRWYVLKHDSLNPDITGYQELRKNYFKGDTRVQLCHYECCSAIHPGYGQSFHPARTDLGRVLTKLSTINRGQFLYCDECRSVQDWWRTVEIGEFRSTDLTY